MAIAASTGGGPTEWSGEFYRQAEFPLQRFHGPQVHVFIRTGIGRRALQQRQLAVVHSAAVMRPANSN
ncbi:MAG: hypothetical protein BGO92_05925 [Magnetospirillum sp. 64-120]|nr:MAG: hypothetical protein BGO92_05925 [Magnetospirillum sp. 64-120]